jgi:DNA-binding NtrC family response regulator
MKNYRIMAVDDEKIILESIKDYLYEFNVNTFIDSRQALDELKNNYYDIIIVDYKMPEVSGLELLIESRKSNSYFYGILLTAYADKELLEEFINQNLIKKIIEKPLKLSILKKLITDAIKDCKKKREEEEEVNKFKAYYENILAESNYLNRKIIGMETSLRPVFEKIIHTAKTNENILITGETGTGKEIIARAVHSMSKRKDKPFVKINCGAIPEHLIESELFGYCKGAFTGASSDKSGKIELANSGTLFLDEIGELKPDMQTRLLHVIQDKQLERLGSNKVIDVDFRLVSATNKNLKDFVHKNLFREDLFYRIETIPIQIPPLRERLNDLNSLIKYFLEIFSKELNKKNIAIDSEAVEKLKEYSWPGNIRELENVIKRAIILLPDNQYVIHEDQFFYLSLSRKENNNNFNDLIDQISKLIINKKHSLKETEKLILNSILDNFNGNVMDAVRNTNIAKNKFYRNR